MMHDISIRQFLELLRSGLWGTQPDESLFSSTPADWKAIYRLASEQAVMGVVFDGILMLPSALRPEKPVFTRWMSVMLRVEESNERFETALAALADLYASASVPFVLLKGQGVAREYANPFHRQCGDIDAFVGQEYMDRADAALLADGGKYSHETDKKHKHSNILWKGVTVENHWMLSKFYNKTLSARMDEWEREGMQSAAGTVDVKGRKVRVPSPEFNSMYLLVHAVKHFMSMGLGLRQLCDWAMVLRNHSGEFDLERWTATIERLGLDASFKAFGCLAVRHLGLDSGCIPYDISQSTAMADAILADILENGNFGHKSFRERRANVVNLLHRRVRTFNFLMKRHFRFRSLYPGEADIARFKMIYGALWKVMRGKA